jgi:hypothetical protein
LNQRPLHPECKEGTRINQALTENPSHFNTT